jgi:hypothetical protein
VSFFASLRISLFKIVSPCDPTMVGLIRSLVREDRAFRMTQVRGCAFDWQSLAEVDLERSEG